MVCAIWKIALWILACVACVVVLDTLSMFALRCTHKRVMLLVQVIVEEVTRMLKVMAILRAITTVIIRVPSFLLSDSHSILEYLRAIALRGMERTITVRDLKLVVAVIVKWDIRLMGVSKPWLSRRRNRTLKILLVCYLFIVFRLMFLNQGYAFNLVILYSSFDGFVLTFKFLSVLKPSQPSQLLNLRENFQWISSLRLCESHNSSLQCVITTSTSLWCEFHL